LVLEDITQQLLESKHLLYLGQLLKIALDLKQYIVTRLAPRKITIIVLGSNMVIVSVAIDLHMAMLHVQVGNNIVEDILLD
jgi:hypothetical protein